MKTKRRKGFTFVELVIVVIIGLIVVLAAGMVAVAGQRTWNEAWKDVNLQRDASYAMLRMSGSIKAGRSAELESEGKAVRIYRETNWIRFLLPPGTNDLIYQIEGQNPVTIINGKVEDVNFSVQGNKVGIDLRLEEDNLETHFTSTVMMRNYGG